MKMKKIYTDSIRQWSVLLMALLLFTACSSGVREEAEQMLMSYINIYVYPENAAVNSGATRADEGTVAEITNEDAIYDVQVWAFRSGADGTATPIGYVAHPYSTTAITSGTPLRMPFYTSDIASADTRVDFYAVANVSALNSTAQTTLSQGKALTKSALEAVLLTGNDFGTSTPVHAVPATGLPMSKIKMNQPITSSAGTLTVETQTISLRRAVSKLRLCVLRKSDQSNCQLLSFDIKNGLIAANEYLFPNEGERAAHLSLTGTEATDYVNGFTYTATFDDSEPTAANYIPASATPENFIYENWRGANPSGTAQDYDTYLTNNTAQYGLTYLRETDKALTGTIYYSLDGGTTTESADFSMEESGDFVRNHSWVVLVLFEGGKVRVLQVVNIGIADWATGSDVGRSVHNW